MQIWTHPDNPRIYRVAQAYREQNPQIAMSSAGLPLRDPRSALFDDDDD